ncbi:hypothetical protein CHS0354_032600 [Potamilus streckersoni]|uniref:Uncharacterized protein n=1 Tax=Potamilus streckersoni TaxID=2493646 RepID=A0AAE0T8D3_9BIVA|nr:hypothetical protein CHS0354_032600 [Potamilus streckersoni]
MGILDSIQRDSFQYNYYEGSVIRYGFEWRLGFFETYFRADHIGKTTEDVRLGTVMVGAAYAIDSSYFREIGAYDDGMKYLLCKAVYLDAEERQRKYMTQLKLTIVEHKPTHHC